MPKKRRALDAFLRIPQVRSAIQPYSKPTKRAANGIKPPIPSIVSTYDRLFAEDATGRVRIKFINALFDVAQWPTGVVLALRGHLGAGSIFATSDLCLAGIPPQPSRKLALSRKGFSSTTSECEAVVALASGLGWGATGFGFSAVKMTADFVAGFFGPRESAARVVQFVIAGGVFREILKPYEIDPMFDDECVFFCFSKNDLSKRS